MELESGLIRSHYGKLRVLVRLADSAVVVAALWLACLIYDHPWEMRHTVAAGLAVLLFQAVGDAVGVGRPWRVAPMSQQASKLLLAWLLVLPGLLSAAFFAKASEDYSRVTVGVWFLLAPAILMAWRTVMRLFLQEVRVRGRNTRTVAIVGATEAGERVAQEIRQNPWFGLRIIGFYDDRNEERCTVDHRSPDDEDERDPAELGGLRGNFDDLLEGARSGEIDAVYVALPLRADRRIRQLVTRLADTTASVHVVTDLLMSDLLRGGWSSVGGVPVLSVYETPFQGVNSWLKRAEDVLLGSVILALISIPMLVIAAAIKLTSKGPVFFRQNRYGLHGQPIRVLKFRSMTVCEDGAVVKQATANDARITRLGAFLRRTSLDELPQFLNVITGEMSIVGPRPHAVAHNELYRKQIPGYMLRHKVKPGITGWAQVNGWRGETDTLDKMAKRVEHDLAYIGRWDLLLDLKIIFLTVFGRDVRRNAH